MQPAQTINKQGYLFRYCYRVTKNGTASYVTSTYFPCESFLTNFLVSEKVGLEFGSSNKHMVIKLYISLLEFESLKVCVA